jgi:putative FmdB family regulatory protein
MWSSRQHLSTGTPVLGLLAAALPFAGGLLPMPTFDYVCEACAHTDDLFVHHPDKAAPLVICPKCGVRRFKRQTGTGSGFLFRGTGFYATDYKTPKGKVGDED